MKSLYDKLSGDTGQLNKNAAFNVIKNVCAIVFPLITFPYISRILGPENTGKINFSDGYHGVWLAAACQNLWGEVSHNKIRGGVDHVKYEPSILRS